MNDHARLLFFATLRDKAGVRETDLEFPQGTKISDIKKLVWEKYPGLKQNMDSVIVALNHEFAFDEDIVPNEAEIAIFPPVSGGGSNSSKCPTIIAVTEDNIDINEILAKITLPTTGAACVFTGIVRGLTSRGVERQTERLEYEAYREMAELKLCQISDEIRAKWTEVEGIALVQRKGMLIPGNVSVIVACTSSHRDEGIFDAARYGIDRLKEIVPIWKKEVSEDREEWVEGEYFPRREE
jgi:molybdopterin converting factor subunit 1